MSVRSVQNSNAQIPILVTVLGIIVVLQPVNNLLEEVSMMALQLFLLSYIVFALDTVIVFKLEQLLKANNPRLVTDAGM